MAKLVHNMTELADKACLLEESKHNGNCPCGDDGPGDDYPNACLECNKKWLMAEVEENTLFSSINNITTNMMEHLCDNLCCHAKTTEQESLDAICAECKMSQYVCDILNIIGGGVINEVHKETSCD
jgi:hypothetical protein